MAKCKAKIIPPWWEKKLADVTLGELMQAVDGFLDYRERKDDPFWDDDPGEETDGD